MFCFHMHPLFNLSEYKRAYNTYGETEMWMWDSYVFKMLSYDPYRISAINSSPLDKMATISQTKFSDIFS